MRYLVLALPPEPATRAARIAFEREAGGMLYARPDGTTVLVRASWAYPSPSALSVPDPLPGDWTEITS